MFAIAPLALLILTSPQEPHDVLATYTLDGQPATVTRTDVALEMAFHLQRRERGRQAAEMIVDTMVTRSEAERLGLMPGKAEVLKFWETLKEQLAAAGRKPEEFAAVRNTNEEQWLADLSVQIAQERLVRRELGLGENESVSGDMLKLWLGEIRARRKVETDPDKLPVGTAAQVDKDNVPLIDLGFLLLRTSEDSERDRFIRQVIYLQTIELMAEQRLITISLADLDRAIEERRKQAKKDPRFGGVSFKQLLKAEGMTIASLRALRVFRSQILLDKLATIEFSDEQLRAELITKRDEVLAKVGPRRRLGVIFVRALKTPNAIITRNFDQAQEHLQGALKRIDKDGFAATASIESEHRASKQTGGDVGWHRQSSKELPGSVINAAFALKMMGVSMPIRAKDGCYLVTVLDQEPIPSDAVMLRRLRTSRAQQFSEDILVNAKASILQKDGTASSNNPTGNDNK